MQRTWWPEAGTIIVTGPYSLLFRLVASECTGASVAGHLPEPSRVYLEYFEPPTISSAHEVLNRSRCRERMEAHYYFGESAPIGRPSGNFVPQTTTRPKHGRRRHLDYSIPCHRILVPSMIMLLWLVSRAVLHPATLCDKPVSTSIWPIACDIWDLCQRIPSTALCLGKRSIGNPLLPSSIPPRNHRVMFIFTLLILCGDVECNPEPHCETIYPCGLCDRGWLGCQRNSMWLLQHVVSLLVYQYAVHRIWETWQYISRMEVLPMRLLLPR